MNIEIKELYQAAYHPSSRKDHDEEPICCPRQWQLQSIYNKVNDFLETRRKYMNDKEYVITNLLKSIHCLHDDCLIENMLDFREESHTIRLAGDPEQVRTLEQILRKLVFGIEYHRYGVHTETYTAPDTLHIADYHSIEELETALKEESLEKTGA